MWFLRPSWAIIMTAPRNSTLAVRDSRVETWAMGDFNSGRGVLYISYLGDGGGGVDRVALLFPSKKTFLG